MATSDPLVLVTGAAGFVGLRGTATRDFTHGLAGASVGATAQVGAQSFDGILPESGDYTIQISAPAGTRCLKRELTWA